MTQHTQEAHLPRVPIMDRETFLTLDREIIDLLKVASFQAGQRLRRIRDEEGWVWSECSSFNKYIQYRFGKSHGHAYRLIKYAELVDAALARCTVAVKERIKTDSRLIPTERFLRRFVLEVCEKNEQQAVEALVESFSSGDRLE
jgi:hypothetical protein